MFTKFKSVKFKIAGIVLFLLVISALAFYTITLAIMNRYILNEVLKRSEALSKSIAASSGYSLLSKDFLGLDNMVFKMRESNQDVESIAIVGPDMKVVAHSDIAKAGKFLSPSQGRLLQQGADGTIITDSTSPSVECFEIISPIVSFNKRQGSVILNVNKSALHDAQHAARKRIMTFFAVILMLGIAGSIALSSFLTKPIEELSAGVDDLKEGKRYRQLKIYSQDEFGKLTASFNEMMVLIDDQSSKLNKYAKDLEDAYVSTVRVLAAAIDARDPYTHGHSTRVSMLSLQLGREIGLGNEALEELEVSCLFHDIGKIKTPDSILRKRGKLNEWEYKEMMRHTEYGADILSKAPSLQKYIPPVRHHHEWFNGKGYPDRLKGDDIPLFAAIIAITDTYDAMTSSRPYRSAISEIETLEELMKYAGAQFQPDLVKVFTGIMDKRITEEMQESVKRLCSSFPVK
ncbi:MAG TPA: HD domain-containing phosphohydrolase [Nitrospirota bacterium]|nr:HD domain-containing phosphohydrolase [Nitrospirota bacterium]